MKTIFLVCFSLMLLVSPVLAGSKGFNVAPQGTKYVRQNQFGGYDYYNRQGKIGWNHGSRYYDRQGMYMRTYNNRIHNTRR